VASGVVVESGGTLSMEAGFVSNLTVESGGIDIVHFGTTLGTTVLGGATEYVSGGAVSSTNISSGGVESIGAGYSFNTTVSGGAVEVLSGVTGVARAYDTTVLSGGELIVAGIAVSISAAVAGTESLQSGGEDWNSTIESGGLHVVAQGRSYYAALSGGGEEIVSSGGRAIFTTVNSGGEEIVSSGGAATDLIVSSGGIAVVSSGGSEDLTELKGGYELVASGGSMSGATIYAGTLELASGASVLIPSEVAFAGSGTLLVDGGTSFGWHVAGFGAGDQIDLEDIAFGTMTTKKGQNSQVSYTGDAVSGTLSVTDGVHTANIALLGQYMASEFAVSNDGHGGTLITFTPDTTPIVIGGGGNGHH